MKQAPKTRSFLKTLFYSPEEDRLRAGWRILGMALLLLITSILFSTLLILFPRAVENSSVLLLLNSLVFGLAITTAIFLARRWLDRRTIGSLGLHLNKTAVADFLAGIGAAGLIMGLIYLLEWSFGWLDFQGFAWNFDPMVEVLRGVALMLAIFTLVGWYEELLMRGYLLHNLADGLNLFWGVVISSSIFALGHIANPNASWTAVLGLILAGFFLAYGLLRTKALWLPIGLHLGWNFFEGTVFGFAVSGIDSYTLIRQTVEGPDLITGGSFGPEAGLIVIPGLLLGAAIIYLYTRNRNMPIENEI